ncbi:MULTISPECIES: hypothetical protein [Jeotgalicoccus]|uniref:hypothetical protein n=1 Tax=Jeotgalicoccus TaxID=227979 RepID=UPI00040CB7A2|nr:MULTISPECIES: hypothetical protein [Jeotgalicoccus]QQD85189.1 hypothetical protein JEM45_00745 [Jeotgalicoccus sp. ATCC 8456]
MKRNLIIFTLLAVTVVPLIVWLSLHRRVDTKKIVDNLHLQFEDISFISLDYQADGRNRFGLNTNTISGVLHVGNDDNAVKYNFLADPYTAEIMEITIQ